MNAITAAGNPDAPAAAGPEDADGRPLRWHCRCLRIDAPHVLSLVETEAAAPGPGEVLVQVGYGGICGSDLHYFHAGGFGTVRIQRPMILGHEVAGTVVAVGEGVSKVAPGDRVAVNPSRPCRACRYCLEGLPNQCLDMRFYGSAMRDPHVEGAFRTHLLCEARQCEPVAPGVPLELAAMAEPFAVALHGVTRAGPLVGRRVLVSGCGPIGALALVAARLHGAAEVVAVDVVPETLAVARALGAHATVDAAAEPGWAQRFAADKGTFDVMFECSGHAQALAAGLQALRPRGIVVQLGLGGEVALPQNVVVGKELELRGSFRFHDEFALAVRLINEGRADLRPLLSGIVPLSRAREGFELASDRRRAMKVLLDFAA